MNIKQTKQEIKQLKQQIKAAKRTRNARLIKLVFVAVVVALIAAYMTGRIQLW